MAEKTEVSGCALAAELHRILASGEVLRAESFPSILNATGYGTNRVPVVEIETALNGLVALGHVEVEHRRGRRYFRAMDYDASPR